MSEESARSKGVAAIGYTLSLISFLAGVYALAILSILGYSVCRAIIGHEPVDAVLWNSEMPLPLIAFVFVGYAGLCGLCYVIGIGVRRYRRWAIYLTILAGIVLVYLGAKTVRELYLPSPPWTNHTEDPLAYAVASVSLAVGTWWIIYLNLPHVRRSLSNSSVSEPLSGA